MTGSAVGNFWSSSGNGCVCVCKADFQEKSAIQIFSCNYKRKSKWWYFVIDRGQFLVCQTTKSAGIFYMNVCVCGCVGGCCLLVKTWQIWSMIQSRRIRSTKRRREKTDCGKNKKMDLLPPSLLLLCSDKSLRLKCCGQKRCVCVCVWEHQKISSKKKLTKKSGQHTHTHKRTTTRGRNQICSANFVSEK